jgi:hypothetical protein
MTVALWCCVCFVSVSTGFAAEDAKSYLRLIERRFEAHSNGFIKYSRNVYIVDPIDTAVITDAGRLGSLRSSGTLFIKDYATMYYRRTHLSRYLDNIAYRLDVYNTLPVPPPPEAPTEDDVAAYSRKFYHKVLIRDPEADLQFAGIMDYRSSDRFASTMLRSARVPTLIDSGTSRPVPLAVEAIFSPVALYGLSGKAPADAFHLKNTEVGTELSISYLGKGKLLFNGKQLVRLTTVDGMLGDRPTVQMDFRQYQQFGQDSLPTQISEYYIFPAGDLAESMAAIKAGHYAKAHYAGLIADIKIDDLQFDQPEFAEKVSFSPLEGKVVADFRIPERIPYMHKFSSEQTLEEIRKAALEKNALERSHGANRHNRPHKLAAIALTIIACAAVASVLFWRRSKSA